MEWLWPKLSKPFQVFLSYCIALARLVVWTILLFFTGLQRTLFMRSEVVSVDMKVMPLRCDLEETDEKLAYIDKLCLENPDLMELTEDPNFNDKDIPFDEGEGD